MPLKMVNRVKETAPAKASNADESTEIVYLKMKNRDLAKKLAELQKNYIEVNKDKDLLQEALFNEKSRANGYANKIQDVVMDCRTALAQIVGLSNTLTNIIGKVSVNNIHVTPFVDNNKTTATPQKQKTKAVKPMVSGCTISKPTIKLNRISDQLLQATINNNSDETRNDAEEETQQSDNNVENVLQPVVNIRRLPERLNLDELQQQMENDDDDDEDDNEEEMVTDSERLLVNPSPQPLSIIVEQTEIGNSRALQLNEDSSVTIENSIISRFTSTPLTNQGRNPINEPSPSCSSSSTAAAATPPSTSRSIFITKRQMKRSSPRKLQRISSSPRRSLRKFQPGSPRVVLKRLSSGSGDGKQQKPMIKSEIKTEPMSPVKRTRRNNSGTGVSYKEPSLRRKMRRER